MKSGKGFHETFNQVFVDAFRKELMRTKGISVKEANQVLPPPYWEYKKLPWFFGLCVKIFRKDPQLAPDVKEVLVDKSNETVSQAKLIRARQYRHHATNFLSSPCHCQAVMRRFHPKARRNIKSRVSRWKRTRKTE
jgi:hypothetical protein